MKQQLNTGTDSELQIENGKFEEKQPLKDRITTADKVQIIEIADRTDDVRVPCAADERPSLFKKGSKRKYRTYDKGKRNVINLAPLTKRGIRIENILKEKTDLTRNGLILAGLCVLLTLTLIIFLCIFLWPDEIYTKYPVCLKPSCFRASAEMFSKLNLNESPCLNFYNYACGNWSTNSLPTDRAEWNVKELLRYKYRYGLHQLLTTETILDSRPLKTMKNFYDSCMKINSSSEMIEMDFLKSEIVSLGGWALVDSDLQMDIGETLEKLHTEYNISPYFRVEVIPDPLNLLNNIIILRPPVLGLPDLNLYKERSETSGIVKAYKRYIQDIVLHYGVPYSVGRYFSDDVFSTEQRLVDYMQRQDENSTEEHYTRLKLKELINLMNPVKIESILLGILSNSIELSSTVLVENKKYFQRFPAYFFLKSENSNKYMIWRFLDHYVPYLSENIAASFNEFQKFVSNQYTPLPRWEFCIDTLQKYAGLMMLILFESDIHYEEREKASFKIDQLFSEASSITRKYAMKLKEPEMRQKIFDKLTKMKIQIGLPPYMLNSNFITDYYRNFKYAKFKFYENIQNADKIALKMLRTRLGSSRKEDLWLDDMISKPLSVSYNPISNYIIVPEPLLQLPYFEREYPLTVLYGGIGTEIAKTFVESLLPVTTNKERNKYVLAISECILEKDFSKTNITNKEEFIVTLTSLKFSYECLREELLLVEPSHQPGTELFKDEELFFINHAQSSCSVMNHRDTEYYRNHINSEIPNNRTSWKNVLLELPEFSELYSCS